MMHTRHSAAPPWSRVWYWGNGVLRSCTKCSSLLQFLFWKCDMLIELHQVIWQQTRCDCVVADCYRCYIGSDKLLPNNSAVFVSTQGCGKKQSLQNYRHFLSCHLISRNRAILPFYFMLFISWPIFDFHTNIRKVSQTARQTICQISAATVTIQSSPPEVLTLVFI